MESQAIAVLTDRIDALADEVNAINARMKLHAQQLDGNIEFRLSAVERQLLALQEQVAVLIVKVAVIEERLSVLTERVNSLAANVAQMQLRLASVERRLTRMEFSMWGIASMQFLLIAGVYGLMLLRPL